MILGKVVGEIYSTINHPFYDGKKLLIVRQLKPNSGYLIAVDSVDAGVGETVLVIDEGNSARQVDNAENAPIRSIIIGIVDEISIPESGASANSKP
ncbi:MAG: propanediol utilization microcompartment protein PduN [Calditrichia bacterium]